MKELLEAISKDDLVNANCLFNETLKRKIKDKLDQKKKEVMEPVHVDSFDVKDNHENVHEGFFADVRRKELVSKLNSAGFKLVGSGRCGHDKYTHPQYPELGHVELPRHTVVNGAVANKHMKVINAAINLNKENKVKGAFA